jgi:hypothetical protein
MRYAAKRDAVEPAIVDALERAGCVVKRLSQDGVGDLLVKRVDGVIFMLECKSRRGRRTPAQERFLAKWGDVPLVRTPVAALEAVGADRLWIVLFQETGATP